MELLIGGDVTEFVTSEATSFFSVSFSLFESEIDGPDLRRRSCTGAGKGSVGCGAKRARNIPAMFQFNRLLEPFRESIGRFPS